MNNIKSHSTSNPFRSATRRRSALNARRLQRMCREATSRRFITTGAKMPACSAFAAGAFFLSELSGCYGKTRPRQVIDSSSSCPIPARDTRCGGPRDRVRRRRVPAPLLKCPEDTRRVDRIEQAVRPSTDTGPPAGFLAGGSTRSSRSSPLTAIPLDATSARSYAAA